MRNRYASLILLPLLFIAVAGCTSESEFSVVHLRTEYMKAPRGVDVRHPRFTWQMKSDRRGERQAAYQVFVSTSPKLLSGPEADSWNSGKISSDQSANVAYEGRPLKSDQTYYWKVHVWDRDSSDAWSRTGQFHTGLFQQSDWKGRWISAKDTSISAPLLRKEFSLKKKIRQATAFVTGVGYYELYLNGKKVGDHVMDPGMTNYRKRVLYAVYDVTDQLKKGGNAVGIMLGNGAWRMEKIKNRYTSFHHPSWGPLRAILQLDIRFEDGTSKQIVTDSSWKSNAGPITYNNFYGGEDYDARKEQKGWATAGFDDGNWEGVNVVASPGGMLRSQMMPPMKVVKTIRPVKKTNPSKGVYLFDLGQNIAGWWRIRVKGKQGVTLHIWGTETLNDSLFPTPLHGGDQLSTKFNYHTQVYTDYTLNGGGEEVYEPHFFYTGFRYIEVSTDRPEALDELRVEGRVVQTALPHTGEFTTSDSLINKIHKATVWAITGNTHSYPSDCPQREKGAYTGDGEVIAESALQDFNMAAFYTNWMADMHDAQFDNGKIPNTAPRLVGGYGGGIPWGSAYILIPSWMYEYYGDKRLLKTYYSSMKRYLGYLHNLARHDSNPKEEYIINDFGTYWYSLGEWCAPGQNDGPDHPVVSTAYWYYDVKEFADIAQVLHQTKDADHYRMLADTIRKAFNQKFLDTVTNLYGTRYPYQTFLVLATAFDLVPSSHRKGVLNQLVHDIVENRHDHLNTGILGTKYLFPVLIKSGRGDLAYKIVTQKTYPGWGYWITHGATTLWEKWSGKDSHNHQMFGSVDEYFYKYLAGIRAPSDTGTTIGYSHVLIKPCVPDGLQHAAASVETIRGEIKSAWTREGTHLKLVVEIPANTSGKVCIPKSGLSRAGITESGHPVWSNGKYIDGDNGISGAAARGNYIAFNVASGKYEFELTGE